MLGNHKLENVFQKNFQLSETVNSTSGDTKTVINKLPSASPTTIVTDSQAGGQKSYGEIHLY